MIAPTMPVRIFVDVELYPDPRSSRSLTSAHRPTDECARPRGAQWAVEKQSACSPPLSASRGQEDIKTRVAHRLGPRLKFESLRVRLHFSLAPNPDRNGSQVREVHTRAPGFPRAQRPH